MATPLRPAVTIGYFPPQEASACSSRVRCFAPSSPVTTAPWVQSYVTGDKIYCVYRAKDPDIIREHAPLRRLSRGLGQPR
jgi:Protein of unknown function (DUF4242)